MRKHRHRARLSSSSSPIDSGIVASVSTAILIGLALLAAIGAVLFWVLRRRSQPKTVESSVAADVVAHDCGSHVDAGGVELGPYKLVEKIGEGGMAEVFTAV